MFGSGALTLLVLSGCAASTGIGDGPQKDLFSDASVARARADCLRDLGWSVQLDDGVILAQIPEAQREQYEADNLTCMKKSGIDPAATMTDEQFAAAYRWYTEIADCLDVAGFATPHRPSEQAFQDTYDSDPWIPWADVEPGDMPRAMELCPVMRPPTS